MTREEQKIAALRDREIKIAASNYVEENSVNGYEAISSHRDSFIEGANWADEHPNLESLWQKQEIDWEQRRYEIAKEMMPVLYRQGIEDLKYGFRFREEIVDDAVNFADMLIEKLKKGGEK